MQNNHTEQEGRVVLLPDEKDPQQQALAVLEEPEYAIVETNLHKYHFGSLSGHSTAKGKNISEVVERGRDQNGMAFERRWKVIGSAEFGYPNWLDEKVLIGLLDTARRRSFPVQNPVQVRISDLCRIMGLDPESGKNREMVRISLKRIGDAKIESKGALFVKRKNAHVTDRFSVLQEVKFAGETLEDGTKATCTFVWLSEKILDNLNTRYFIPVDTRFFMKLSPTAGRLYQLLATRFFGLQMSIKRGEQEREGAHIVETYHDLCRRMPLEAQEYPSRAQQQFQAAHKQLLNSHFLAQVEWKETNEILYYPGAKAVYDFENALNDINQQLALGIDSNNGALSNEPIGLEIEGPRKARSGLKTLVLLPQVLGDMKTPELVSNEQIEAFSNELKSRGVSARQANQLIVEFGQQRTAWNGREYPTIDFYLQFFDYMLNAPQPKKPQSGAWIVKAIREAWFPELDFRTREEKAGAVQAAAAAKKRQEQAEQDREEAATRQQYFNWLGKTPEQRWNTFLFEMEFRQEHQRPPTAQESTDARAAYLADPETPEAYQLRVYGKVRYPLTTEGSAP
jgi:hypothetical protein